MAKHTDQLHIFANEQSLPILSTILQAAYDAIIVVNQEQEIILFNQKAEQLFGYLGIEIIGKPLNTLLMTPSLLDIPSRKAGELREISVQRQDGTTFLVEAGIGKTSTGSQTIFTIILRDITEHKQMEEEVRKSRELFRTAFEYSAIGMCLTGLDGKFILVNKAMCEMFGRSKDEFEGKHFNDFTHPEDFKIGEDFASQMLSGKTPTVSFEKRYLKKNGQVLWVNISTALVKDAEGKPFHFITQIKDITAQKEAEQSNQRHRKILQLFIEHAPAAIAMFDTEMKYISVSHRFLTDYDIEDLDIIGKSHYEIFPEIPERWKEIHRRCLKGATEQCDEDPFMRANGKLDWIQWEIRPWYESAEKIGGIILFSEVITAQKKAIEALQGSEKKFRDLFHKHSAAKLLVDPNSGNIMDANEAAEKFYGWSKEQLKQMRAQDINTLPPDEVQAAMAKARDKQRYRFEFIHRLADGSTRDVEVYSSMVTIDGKDLLYSIIHDVTERKQAEKALQRYAERLQNLHSIDQAILMTIETPESMAQMILKNTCHLVKCQQAKIMIYEPGMETAHVVAIISGDETISLSDKSLSDFDRSHLDLFQKGAMEIVEDNETPDQPSEIAKIIGIKETRSFINVPLVSDKGGSGILSFSWEQPRKFTNEEIEIFSEVANQITIALEQIRLRKEVEDYTTQLEQRVTERTAQLEASNEELEAFAYSVSHDLRAPLRGIVGFSQILEQDYAQSLDHEGKRLLGIISHNASKMDHLITDLLDLARVSRSEMDYTHIDMTTLVHSIYQEIATPEVQNKFTFIVSRLPDVHADLILIRQLWTNLISNAVKYSFPQEHPVIEINGDTQNGMCTFTIRDNGVGFNPLHKDKLFNLFQRLHSESEFEGTGVGLAIVQRIVVRHGGQTWAEGEVGKGATFYFTLPQNQSEHPL